MLVKIKAFYNLSNQCWSKNSDVEQNSGVDINFHGGFAHRNRVDLPGLILSAAICQNDMDQSAVPPGGEEVLFGKNLTLRHLLEDGLSFRKDMIRTKEEYLKLYAVQFKKIALEARIGTKRAFNSGRNGYET